VRCQTVPDLAEFAGRALPFLERDPVRNSNAYTLVAERHLGGWPVEPGGLWVCVTDDGGELVGLALQPSGHSATRLTDLPPAAVLALADHLAASGVRLPGVSGPVETVRGFALRWASLTGADVVLTASRRLFRLDELSPPARVPGRLREAGPDDRDLLDRWSAAFGAEATPDQARPDLAAAIDLRLARGGMLWLWEVDSTPVSMLRFSLPGAGVIRISGVYTPPEHRRHGYASAGVAAASQAALEGGATDCVLNTDLANPTSNRIYQAIGYRPVQDCQIWSFRPGPPAGGHPGEPPGR
jgi:GNAT superfamily N-acetyltransferase